MHAVQSAYSAYIHVIITHTWVTKIYFNLNTKFYDLLLSCLWRSFHCTEVTTPCKHQSSFVWWKYWYILNLNLMHFLWWYGIGMQGLLFPWLKKKMWNMNFYWFICLSILNVCITRLRNPGILQALCPKFGCYPKRDAKMNLIGAEYVTEGLRGLSFKYSLSNNIA